MANMLTQAEIQQRVAEALQGQQDYYGFLGGYSQAARTVNPETSPIKWLEHKQRQTQEWLRDNSTGKIEINALGKLGDAAGDTIESVQSFATAELSVLASALNRVPGIDSNIYVNFDDTTIEQISTLVANRYHSFAQNEARLRVNPEPTFGQRISAFFTFAIDWITGNTQGRGYDDYMQAQLAQDVVGNQLERTRDFATGLRRELETMTMNGEELGAHIAEYVAGVDEHGRFIDEKPVYVDASDTDLLQQIQIEQKRVRPTAGNHWEQALSGDTRAVAAGVLVAVLGTAAAIDNRVTRTAGKAVAFGGKFSLGALEGVGQGMRDLTLVTRMATDRIAGTPSMPRTAGRVGQFFDALDNRAAAGTAFRTSRGLSRVATFAGAIPLVGGVAVSGINLVLYNDAVASDQLKEEQLATLRTILLADSAAGFGGFLADGASTANIEAHRALMDPNDPLQKFLPATLVSLAKEALTEHDGKSTISTIEQAKSILRHHENDLSSYARDHGSVWKKGQIAGVVDAWISMAETTPVYKNFEQNPYSQNPVMKTLHAAYKENPYGRKTFTDFLKLATDINLISTLELTNESAEVSNHYMSEATLFRDLSNRGPAYQRLLEHSLQQGLSLHEFDTEIIRTLGGLGRNIVNDTTPNTSKDRAALATLAVLPPKAFGGGLENLITIPNTAELAAYNASRGKNSHSEKENVYADMVEQLRSDVVRSEAFVLKRLDAYIELELQGGDTASISKERLVTALHNNEVLTAWSTHNPEQYQQFALAVNNADMSVEEALKLLDPSYTEFSKTDSAQAVYKRVSTELESQQGQAYKQLVALIIGDGTSSEAALQESLDAIEMALLLPENLSSSTTELQALLKASAKLRTSFAAIPANSETITAEHISYHTALREMSGAMRTYRGYEKQQAETQIVNANKIKTEEHSSLIGDTMTKETDIAGLLDGITDKIVASGNKVAAVTGATQVAGVRPREMAFAKVTGVLAEAGVSGGRDSSQGNSKMAPEQPTKTNEASNSTDLGLSRMFS